MEKKEIEALTIGEVIALEAYDKHLKNVIDELMLTYRPRPRGLYTDIVERGDMTPAALRDLFRRLMDGENVGYTSRGRQAIRQIGLVAFRRTMKELLNN